MVLGDPRNVAPKPASQAEQVKKFFELKKAAKRGATTHVEEAKEAQR